MSGRAGLVSVMGEQTVVAARNRQFVDAQEHRKPDPGVGMIAVPKAVPWHNGYGHRPGDHKHQQRRPIVPRRFPLTWCHNSVVLPSPPKSLLIIYVSAVPRRTLYHLLARNCSWKLRMAAKPPLCGYGPRHPQNAGFHTDSQFRRPTASGSTISQLLVPCRLGRYAGDFKVRIADQCVDPDEGARREMAVKIASVHGVECIVQTQIRAIHGD